MKKRILQDFFIRRMTEILNKDTLDSYRVRTNNVMTILVELSGVIDNWIAGNIKRFETVSLCIAECKDLIDSDKCLDFSFYDKKLFIEELNPFTSAKDKEKSKEIADNSKIKRLQFFIEECICFNTDHYGQKLLDSIKELLEKYEKEEIEEKGFIPVLDDFDARISAFACELLRKGYSKSYLFFYFKTFKVEADKSSFMSAFKKMSEELIGGKKKTFTVIFKLGFPGDKLAREATESIEGIEENIPSHLNAPKTKWFEEGKTTRFYIKEQKAYDFVMAARLCYDSLSRMFDLNLNRMKKVLMPSMAYTFLEKDNKVICKWANIYTLDKSDSTNRNNETKIYDAINTIENNCQVSEDVKDRLSTALRHLRIGDSQVEIEQQFINYWIALEFIFAAASSKESTFERIKKFLTQILVAIYIKRNRLYLNSWLIHSHKIESDEFFWKKSDEELDKLINLLDDNLLKYRLRKMKSCLRETDSIKTYLKKHANNLEQHLARIYRLRNELIHEAAIKQDIANITSNLRSYLVCILNQLIEYFSNGNRGMKIKELTQFFLTYESWKKLIEQNGNLVVMKVPFSQDFLS